MKKLASILIIALGLVCVVPYSYAFFAGFLISPAPGTVSIAGLGSATSSLTVSIDPARPGFPNEESTSAPYAVKRLSVCDQFDEETGQCTDPIPDLCPYISFEPSGNEPDAIGFTSDLSETIDAHGSLDPVGNPTDDWSMTISSPCFEGECPANYDAGRYGAPLLQSLKGQTFACDVTAVSAEPPMLIRNFAAKHAYADSSRVVRVSAVLIGGKPIQPTAPATTTPVIIVPGIMGSTLVDANGSEVWPDLNRMAIPGSDSYLDILALNQTGNDSSGIVAKQALRSLTNFDFFNALEAQMASVGFSKNQTLFEFPYDWRLDINDVVTKFSEEIDQIKQKTGASKVKLVAHSMGGLLVKKYLNKYGGTAVESFIDIATPQEGAPKAFKALNYGDNFGFEKFGLDILNLDRAKFISQNMPAVYELLPSSKYFNDADPDYRYYVFNGIDTNNRLDFNETKQYLKDAGRNSVLVDQADTFHQQIDDLNPADYGVQTYNIVGCGTPTIGQFYILGEKDGRTEYDIKMINGDGTVPLKSAEAIPAIKTYFAKNAVHATMPSMSGVKDLVVNLLTNDNPDISQYSNISTSESDCPAVNGTLVSFHSPITLNAYDAQGNHSGPNVDGDVEQNIPGSDYEVIDDNKFVFLPSGTGYTIKGDATGVGSFDARVETIVNGEVATTSLWNDVPLTLTTKAQLAIGSNEPEVLALDADGDGISEITKESSNTQAGFVDTLGELSAVATSTESILPISVNPQVMIGLSSGSTRTLQPVFASTSNTLAVITTVSTIPKLLPVRVPTKSVKKVPKEQPTGSTSTLQVVSHLANTASVYGGSPVRSPWAGFKNVWMWIKRRL